MQNFLILQPVLGTLAVPVGLTKTVVAWQCKRLSNEKNYPVTANHSLSPKLKWHNSKMRVEFKEGCSKKDKVNFTPSNVVNLFTVCKLSIWAKDYYFTLNNCLFGAVKLTKNADPGKYSYSKYGI